MNGINEIVEAEKLTFLQQLQDQYQEIDIENISIAAGRIEDIIQSRLLYAFLSNISKIFKKDDISAVGQGFSFDKEVYEVFCSPDVSDASSLAISCVCRGLDTSNQNVFKHNVHLAQAGKYKNVTFYIPQKFRDIDYPLLEQLTNGIFIVGYRWLIDAIARAISKAAANTKQELYQFVRVMIPDEQYLTGFWLSALVREGKNKQKDIIILDDIAARMSMKAAEVAAYQLGQNAASIVTRMMTEVVDYDDSVLSVIDTKTEPFEIDLSKDEYYQSDASFNLSLRGVWGRSVYCYPIITEGEFRLVAFFKPDTASAIIPFLDHHKEHLQVIGNRHAQNIREGLEIMKSVKKISGDTAKLGEFLGGFTTGVVKSLGS